MTKWPQVMRLGALLIALSTIACASGSRPVTSGGLRLPGYVRGSADTLADTVIVFVHGVLGDGTSTWTNAQTGAYFPRLLLDDRIFDSCDIWVEEYPSPWHRGTYSIDEAAAHLRRHLSHDNVLTNHRNVVFVAHSEGGLVVRAFLLKYRDQLPAARVPMVYFYATPTTGSRVADIAGHIVGNPSVAEMGTVRTNKPGTLPTWIAQWMSSPYSSRTRTYCAYETKATYGVMVVQRSSAEHLCNATVDPIDTDHIDIAKPADRDAESFIVLREAFRETLGVDRVGLPMGRAHFNRFGQAPTFLRVSNFNAAPACAACWRQDVTVRPGEPVFVAAHLENNGATARNVRLRLDVPRRPDDEALVVAELTADNATSIDAACTSGPNMPLLLVLVNAVWYAHGSSQPLALPYRQEPSSVLSADGLEVPDVVAGDEHSADIVVEFRAVGVNILAARDIRSVRREVESAIDTSLGTVDVGAISRALTPRVRFAEGSVGHSDFFQDAGWVSHLKNIKPGEQILLCLYVYNDSSKALHDARIFIDQWPSLPGADRYIRVQVELHGQRWDLAATPVTFSGQDSRLFFSAAYVWPYGLCHRGTLPKTDLQRIVLSGNTDDGLPVGDLAAGTATIFALVFEAASS